MIRRWLRPHRDVKPQREIEAPMPDALAAAREVLIALPESGAAPVMEVIQLCPVTTQITALCGEPHDLDTLRTLLEAEVAVYAIVRPPGALWVFADRRRGWTYPEGRPLPDPGRLAAKLSWQRYASFSLLSGVIGDAPAPPGCFRFTDRPHVYLDVSNPVHLAMFRPGAELTTLCRRFFVEDSLPFFLDVLAVWPVSQDAR